MVVAMGKTSCDNHRRCKVTTLAGRCLAQMAELSGFAPMAFCNTKAAPKDECKSGASLETRRRFSTDNGGNESGGSNKTKRANRWLG